MQPNFGTRIREFLFRQSYESLSSDLSESITSDINTWLPYIILDSVDVVNNEHRIDIRIRFRTTRNGANLVINVLAQENSIIVSEPIQDTYSPASSRLEQVYGGI
jgi:phage baseplate assembly protein W